MAEKRLRKYLLYAIGEIVLVVIGILIALQINDLRTRQNNQALKESYIENFKRDLIADTVYLHFTNSDMSADIEYHWDIVHRMDSEGANKDTLVKMIRREFSPYFSPSNSYNTATFDRINANGHMDLLDSALADAILKHHGRQLSSQGMLDKNIQAMFDSFESILQKFPNKPAYTAFGSPMFDEEMGPIEKRFWMKSEEHELYAALNALVIMKIQQQSIIVGVRDQMINWSKELISTLDEYSEE